MSLPDALLDEPLDDGWCEEHNRAPICYACLVEAAEYREDCQREERGHV